MVVDESGALREDGARPAVLMGASVDTKVEDSASR